MGKVSDASRRDACTHPVSTQPLARLAAETSRRGGPGEQNHVFELRPQAGNTYSRADEGCQRAAARGGTAGCPHHPLSTSTAALRVPMLPSVAQSPALVLPGTAFSHREHCRFVGLQLGESQPGTWLFFQPPERLLAYTPARLRFQSSAKGH